MFEEIGILYRGIVLGLVIAAPVGPVGLLCIRRSLQKGILVGFATGIGAAMADALFAAIAVLGVSAVIGFITQYRASIHLIGGLIVLATAWHTWHDHPKPPQPTELVEKVVRLAQENTLMGTARALLSGLAITLTNPLTLFGTLAVVATFGATSGKLEDGVLVSGIFCGSLLWWCFLSCGVGLLRRHFTEKRIVTVNRSTAIMLTVLAAWALINGLRAYLQ